MNPVDVNRWTWLQTTRAATAFVVLLTVCCFCSAPTLWADEKQPVAHWGFGQEESTRLESHGGVHRDIPGPRPDVYPDFAPDNTAVRLDGKGARFTFADPGADSPFDFTNGDELTLEAWVKIDQINEGENVYVIGKGRTGNPKFKRANQNWALRVRCLEGRVHISFLFSSVAPQPLPPGDESNWHRWTSDRGFKQGKEWHHIALAYRFGDPESLLGVIDGQQVKGTWDAGGPTRNPPTVDDDEIWIGSALGGSPGNSLRGDLDEVAIHRQALSLATLKSRYNGPNLSLVAGPLPAVMPDLGPLPEGSVQLRFYEGMPSHSRWLNDGEQLPAETLRCEQATFLMDRIPLQFDSWGIRDYWNAPVLVHMAGDVSLPPGKHRFLMRVRGLSRLWVDGKLVAQGRAVTGSQNGFEPITPPTAPPKPGLRIAEHRQQEVFGDCEISASGKCRVVLETIVGGQKFRTDPGETCVAVETEDGESFVLLQPDGQQHHLTDETVASLLADQEVALDLLDSERRRAAAASQQDYWNRRHELAKAWAEQHPAPKVPGEDPNQHPIDAFLTAKIQTALTASAQVPLAEARQFHDNVLPILRDHCFRCHGDKERGGLLLNSLEAAQIGGESGLPAVTPGDLHKSEIMSRIRSESPEERMPPVGDGLKPEQIKILEDWILSGARWPAPPVTPEMVAATPIISDEAFVRRIYLDTVGVIPSESEVRAFVDDQSADKRTRLVDRLLTDDRWADHWTSYWQDALAENPTLINASLNTTGPFRWYLYDSFLDNKPFDRFVTELVLLRGSAHEGGSAGFGIAANNDAPFAAKGQIIASAFMGIELQCARCHDSPYHSTTQRDLYSLAAMFERKPVTVPSTSRVPAAFFERSDRSSLIQVTLKPGEPVEPAWPFEELTGTLEEDSLLSLCHRPEDTREQLAAMLTAPQNDRFAKVIVNRVWRRFIGAGIVEPPHDWEGRKPSHPDLLDWLAQEFMTHGYDIKYLARLIFTSNLYQRQVVHVTVPPTSDMQFFVSPARRRMSAEQVVDSLCAVAGRPLDVEEMTFAPEAGTHSQYRLTLGTPERAWQLTSLGNERDRPSLSLPRARALADIMEAFGWDGARQSPRTDREAAPNVLQPGVLQNSDASVLLTRASMHSGLADTAVNASSPEQLVDSLFLRILSRFPTEQERTPLVHLLAPGFENRLVPEAEQKEIESLEPLPVVTWSNHVQPEANSIALEMEVRARTGPPADPRLREEWRQVYEDVAWSVVNLSEFVWLP